MFAFVASYCQEALAFKPKLTIKFDIGRRSKNCDKFSICDIEIGISEGKLANNQGNATAEFDKNGKFMLTIDKDKGLTSECYEKYFESGQFIIEEAFDVPENILTELDNSPDSYTLRVGKYPVEEEGNNLIVRF